MYKMNCFEKRLFLVQKSKEGWTGEIEIDKPKWMGGDTTARRTVWLCKFSKARSCFGRVINFNIFLSDGSLLTDAKNDHLLWVIKLFIILQVHPKFLKRLDVGGITQSDYIAKALLFVDWVLIHDNVFDVVNNGFALLSADSINLYLVKCTSPPVTENLYRLSKHLSDWLKPKILTVTAEDISTAELKWPGLSELPDPEERELDLTDAEIVKARVFILKTNMYVSHNGGVRFNSKIFISEEYRNTLLGITMNFKIPSELTWGCVRSREYAMIPVRNPSRPGLTSQVIRDHIRVIKYLTIVDSYIKTGIDSEEIAGLSAGAVRPHIQEKSNDRYRLLPYEIVFYAIKKSYEFQECHTARVLEAVEEVLIVFAMEHSVGFQQSCNISGYFANDNPGFNGFELWTLAPSGVRSVTTGLLFKEMRKCKALYQTYCGLMGCCLILIGLFAARRQEELLNLSTECLYPLIDPYSDVGDSEMYSIDFSAGKTGNPNGKHELRVPVPKMIAKIIWKLRSFHLKCQLLGLIGSSCSLFLAVSPWGSKVYELSPYMYNSYLDRACDLIETPTIAGSDGVSLRFYIRQHQLRGFFATAFFWSAGFYGLDSLRAVLGHANFKHLVRYITKVTPGSMLRVVKAEKICTSLLNGFTDIENLDALKDVLMTRLGVADIFIDTASDVYENYSYQVERGLISVNVSCFSSACSPVLFDQVLGLLKDKVIDLAPEVLTSTTTEGNDQVSMHLVLKFTR
ncbi:hypothetical protein [Pseudomonas sp. CCI3.1]|uniref:hypothetical protein n=1 Tax=Pseudomonas sp. CCI3.1 TaxID=3048618 RepID=UPI002AB34BDA|nr:hypothetical protein [Pseudomonas sp. CCI3.1]MDY7580622.1 hypothetical protein [Pseudomonas sp. CCI3.1]